MLNSQTSKKYYKEYIIRQ